MVESAARRRRGERGYHHGNLKEALIRAALELIAKKGRPASPLRKPRAGPASARRRPIGIIRDRDELLADVARRGFEQFAAALHARLGRRPAGSDRRRSSGSARPISHSRAASRPTTRRCSRPAFRSTAIPNCARRATRLRRAARRDREADRDLAGRQNGRRPDDGAAHLVAVARHRVAVRPRRCGAAQACRWRRRNCWKPAVLLYLRGLGFVAVRTVAEPGQTAIARCRKPGALTRPLDSSPALAM